MEAAGMTDVFELGDDWRDVPPDAILPPGAQTEINLTTGVRRARLMNGDAAPENDLEEQDFQDRWDKTNDATNDETDDEGGDVKDLSTKAKASARRAAWRGEPKLKAVSRIRKQWPALATEAERIVDAAYRWYAKHKPGSLVEIGGIKKRVTSLNELNEHYALLTTPNNQAAVILREDAMPIGKADLNLRLNSAVVMTGINSDAEPVYKDADKVWLGSYGRHIYRNVAFTSEPVPPDTMNLFKRFGCEAIEGDCTRIKKHIFEVWCSSDEKLYEAMLNLIAFQLQKIGHASRIIVVLISKKQQAGKGIVIDEVLLPIFGDAGYATVRIEDATGTFNDAMRGRAFFMLDEALFGGDKAAASRIKGIVATHRLSFNQKFVPLVTLPSAVNLWILSNADQPAYIEEEDARYWPLRVSEHRVGDHAYFQAFLAEARRRPGGVPLRDAPPRHLQLRPATRCSKAKRGPRRHRAAQRQSRRSTLLPRGMLG
jgi:hypothetical protein